MFRPDRALLIHRRGRVTVSSHPNLVAHRIDGDRQACPSRGV